MKKNKLKLGLGMLTVLATPIAVNAVVSNDALAAQGWVKSGNTWYFYNQNGTLARNAWAGNYWLGADGKMVTNAWVDNGRYYVGKDGAWVKGAQKPVEVKKQGWVQSSGTWYFYHQGQIVRNAWVGSYWLGADGKMATSSWVDNGRYYVGANGVWVKDAKKPEAPKPIEKKQGWVKEGNTWYYFENGSVARNKWIGSTYWVGADGKMATNSWVDNGRYYVGVNGAWVKDAKKPETPKPAEKKQGWVKEGTAWYYYHQGQIVKNAWVGSYWLGSDGKMATSAWVDNGRYYVGANGAWDKNAKKQEAPKPEVKKQGWVKEGSIWYYYENGTLARNKWIGSTYWVGTDGKMETNAWVDNGRYYVGANGAWVKDAKKEEAPKPVEKKGWIKEGNAWYFYRQGQITRNAWVGSYWLGSDGKMATNAWVDNGRYYVGVNGVWDKNAKKEEAPKPEVKKQGWVKEGNTWYYYENGTLARSKWISSTYWVGADGKMATNAWVDNGRYYVGVNGAWDKNAKKQEAPKPEVKKQGWVKEETTWYYYENGSLARNKWVGNYWLESDGKMATNAWVDNGRYYVDANGAWVKDASKDKNTKRSIFLDPGHGGSDSGAVSGGVREKDLTLSVYNKVSSKLASLGYTVLTSRNVDKDVDLVDRADQANKANADMLLSIHFNAGGRGIARGIETYYYQSQEDRVPKINKENHNNAERLERSRKLANKVQQNLLYQTGANDRGVKRASFTVLRETSIPSILVELGFIDNPEERNKIKTNEYQERLANGIVDGIVEYYK